MKPMQEIVYDLLDMMAEKNWPKSVKNTMIGAIELAKDERTAAEKVREIIETSETPKMAVKAVQPMLR